MYEPKSDPFRTIKLLAVGAVPSLMGYALISLGRSWGEVIVSSLGYFAFGFLTPVVTANAPRKGSVVVAVLLATLFLGLGTGIGSIGAPVARLDTLPWVLFSWGLFPSLGVTLSLRVFPYRLLSLMVPLTLCAAVVLRIFLPDAILAPTGLALLLLDLFLLRKFPKATAEPAG